VQVRRRRLSQQGFEQFFASAKFVRRAAGIGVNRAFASHIELRFSTALSTRVDNVRNIRSTASALLNFGVDLTARCCEPYTTVLPPKTAIFMSGVPVE